jgi:neurofibromin 1
LEVPPSVDLTYRILIFLNLVPLTLFEGAPTEIVEYDSFFEDVLASLVACLETDDERIRYLSSTIARKLMSDGSVLLLRRSLDSGAHMFRAKFWRSSYVITSDIISDFLITNILLISSIILICVADKVLLLGDQGSSTLSFIRDYLESRITLLKSFKVGHSWYCESTVG